MRKYSESNSKFSILSCIKKRTAESNSGIYFPGWLERRNQLLYMKNEVEEVYVIGLSFYNDDFFLKWALTYFNYSLKPSFIIFLCYGMDVLSEHAFSIHGHEHTMSSKILSETETRQMTQQLRALGTIVDDQSSAPAPESARQLLVSYLFQVIWWPLLASLGTCMLMVHMHIYWTWHFLTSASSSNATHNLTCISSFTDFFNFFNNLRILE